MIKRSVFRLGLAGVCLAAVALAGCLFDKAGEEATLTLTNVPDSVTHVIITAVDRADTSKQLAFLYDNDSWDPTDKIHFDLGNAAGKHWLLRVEGYRKDILVYLSLIPSGKESASETALFPDVTNTWPAIEIIDAAREGDSIRIKIIPRRTGAGNHWHIFAGTDSGQDPRPYKAVLDGYETTVPVGHLIPKSLFIVDLRDPSHEPLPIQVKDTMLAGEALAPAHSSVSIDDAFAKDGEVNITLSYKNFKLYDLDDPLPGFGYPMVHDARGMRPIKSFKFKDGDITSIKGPAGDLDGVKQIVVALHYATGLRIRPAAADTVDVTQAISAQVLRPKMRILSHSINPDSTLKLTLERLNFEQATHVHIYRNKFVWPDPTDYQVCHEDVCNIKKVLWKDARSIIVVVHTEPTHDPYSPAVIDSVVTPF